MINREQLLDHLRHQRVVTGLNDDEVRGFNIAFDLIVQFLYVDTTPAQLYILKILKEDRHFSANDSEFNLLSASEQAWIISKFDGYGLRDMRERYAKAQKAPEPLAQEPSVLEIPF